MAKKPDAARGKTTRIGKIKKIIKGIKAKPKTVGMNMSPGAMGGRTKTKMPLQRLTPAQRRQKLRGMAPMTGSKMGKAAKSTMKGAGASGIGMAKQAMKLAKKLKTTGRLSVDDIMRAKRMMMGKKGK